MYSKDTLKKYHDSMEATIAFYAKFPAESLELCVSEGNIKVDRIPNVSLPPIVTCPNCTECCKDCYDIKACIQYKNVTNARARNYALLLANYELFWKQLRARLEKLAKSKEPLKLFRFHVGGDIPSKRYFADMVKTARMFPMIRFWTYTKNYNAVNEYVAEHGGSKEKAIPSNLSVMFSRWEGVAMVNPYGFGEFIVIEKGEEPPKGAWHCPGNCRRCAELGRGCPVNETSYIEKH